MTTKKRQNIKWGLVAIGLFFIVCFFWSDKDDIDKNSLVTKTIILNKDIKKVIGNRSRQAYYIYAYDYNCDFCILTPGGMAAKSRDNLDNIKTADTLTIKIHESRLADLQVKSEDVYIYSLEINGRPEFTVDDYNIAKQKYSRRWGIIFLVIGAIIMLRGLTLISNKTAFILGGLCFTIIITLRLLNISW